MKHRFGDLLRPDAAAELIAISKSHLARLRTQGEFIEGVHYVKYGERCYRYLSESLYHWATHRQSPDEHRDWILTNQASSTRK